MPKPVVSLMTLLSSHRMCLRCLAERVDDTPRTVEVTLEVIGRALRIQRKPRPCPFCGVFGTVYGLDVPERSRDPR